MENCSLWAFFIVFSKYAFFNFFNNYLGSQITHIYARTFHAPPAPRNISRTEGERPGNKQRTEGEHANKYAMISMTYLYDTI